MGDDEEMMKGIEEGDDDNDSLAEAELLEKDQYAIELEELQNDQEMDLDAIRAQLAALKERNSKNEEREEEEGDQEEESEEDHEKEDMEDMEDMEEEEMMRGVEEGD